MIHYALRCGGGHEFNGWFKNSAGFEDQEAAGLLECPICASTAITRALMAPRIAARSIRDLAVPTEVRAPAPADTSVSLPPGPTMPAHMRAALQRIRSQVERHCDYVGPRFATEVRRMAEADAPAHRPIYGEATDEEAAALVEDGIEVARIPWVPRAES